MIIKNLINKIFKKSKKDIKQTKELVTIYRYDVCEHRWGHGIMFSGQNDDNTHNICGWLTPLPNIGDELLATFVTGVGVCLITKIEYCGDPYDMFHAKIGMMRLAISDDFKTGKIQVWR